VAIHAPDASPYPSHVHLIRRRVLIRAALTALLTANFVLLAITIVGFFVSDVGYDWIILREAGQRVIQGGLYDWEGIYAYSYSPLLAYAFTVLAPIGLVGWSVLHAAALLALRDGRLMLITVLSWPFWVDVYNGNTMIFVFVAAVGALRGSVIGSGAFLALALLMPRPLMLPLLAWVLWKQPRWRLYFPIMVVVFAFLVLLTGQGLAWVETLAGVGEAVAASSRDIGPSALVGLWWVPIGVVLAVVLTYLGRVGLASMAASPYWLPQYLLMTLLELVDQGRARRQVRSPSDPRGAASGGE